MHFCSRRNRTGILKISRSISSEFSSVSEILALPKVQIRHYSSVIFVSTRRGLCTEENKCHEMQGLVLKYRNDN